jgi:hypothetical protein
MLLESIVVFTPLSWRDVPPEDRDPAKAVALQLSLAQDPLRPPV